MGDTGRWGFRAVGNCQTAYRRRTARELHCAHCHACFRRASACGLVHAVHTRPPFIISNPQGDLFHMRGQISEAEVKSVMYQLLQVGD